MSTAACLEDCADDEELRDGSCAELECAVGTATNHECPATQTCRSGDEILAAAVCMQTCASGEKIPESERCMQDCPAGSAELRILESATCMKDCPVVGLRPAGSACPATKRCAAVGLRLASSTCPPVKICGNGEVILETAACPDLQGTQILDDCKNDEELLNGNCVKLNCAVGYARDHQCPATKICPGGTLAVANGTCPEDCTGEHFYYYDRSSRCIFLCPLSEKVIGYGDGKTCECKEGYERPPDGGICVLICGENEAEKGGRTCECRSGYARPRDGGACALICGENEVENGGTCECRSGYARPSGGGSCVELACAGGGASNSECSSTKRCDDGSVVLAAAECLEDCRSNEELLNGSCAELECDFPSQIAENHACRKRSVDECNRLHNGDHLVYDDDLDVCRFVKNVDDCPGDRGLWASSYYVYAGSEGVTCLGQSCPSGQIRVDHVCVYGTEYEASYGTRRVQADYAHQKGYAGQNVTVVTYERVFAAHEDLSGNVLTNYINVDYQNLKFTHTNNQDLLAQLTEYYQTYSGDRFAIAPLTVFGEGVYKSWHGTRVAAAIAAKANGKGGVGVAPEAKIIPIPIDGITHESNRTFMSFILDNNIPIINSSIWPYDPLSVDIDIYSAAKDSDSVFVWAAGNFGSPWKLNSSTHFNLPTYVEGLEDNWLIVVGADTRSDNVITIRCGELKDWCLAAPSIFQNLPGGPDIDGYSRTTTGSSSLAAPVVSGALAVLKSANYALPMTVVRAILLTTAEDLGEPGRDESYGWGMVNVSAGVDHIENMETAETESLPGVNLRAFRSGLPDGFRHLSADMKDISVAV
ncbi:MAG: S8 family serine peptidase, partial [Gammaproteobacteria bacterium]